MKTDVNGCSTTQKGQEQWEEYYSIHARDYRIQYDYRTPNGELFSCIAIDLESARAKRDEWLKKAVKA